MKNIPLPHFVVDAFPGMEVPPLEPVATEATPILVCSGSGLKAEVVDIPVAVMMEVKMRVFTYLQSIITQC